MAAVDRGTGSSAHTPLEISDSDSASSQLGGQDAMDVDEGQMHAAARNPTQRRDTRPPERQESSLGTQTNPIVLGDSPVRTMHRPRPLPSSTSAPVIRNNNLPLPLRLPPPPPNAEQRSPPDMTLPYWQPDAEVTYCPICHTQFSIFVRKHHCRYTRSSVLSCELLTVSSTKTFYQEMWSGGVQRVLSAPHYHPLPVHCAASRHSTPASPAESLCTHQRRRRLCRIQQPWGW